MNKALYALALGLLGAIIVHISVLFLVPYQGQYNTWLRLNREIPPFAFHDLAKDDPIARTADPLFKIRACVFSLEDTPVHIFATGQTPFWSFSLYDSTGTRLYSLNNRTTAGKALDIIIGTPLQIMDLKQSMADKTSDAIPVTQAIDNGIALLRVFAPSKDWDPQVAAFLNNATCSPIMLEEDS